MNDEELQEKEQKFFETTVEGNWEPVVAPQSSTQDTQE